MSSITYPEDRNITVSLHLKRTTARNNDKWILVMDFYEAAWFRKLRHIGAETLPIAIRRATPDEQEAIKSSYRVTYFRYKNITELISDERGRSEDQEWWSKLEELKRKEVNNE